MKCKKCGKFIEQNEIGKESCKYCEGEEREKIIEDFKRDVLKGAGVESKKYSTIERRSK